jgi:hypothetical protein
MSQVEPTATYNDVAKYARNRLRQYSAESICDVALRTFAQHQGNGLEELQSAPWLTALLIKIALEDKQIALRSDSRCPAQLFDSLRQKLWEVSPISARSGATSIFLTLRVMLHTQLLFQQKETFSFLRWPALVLELSDEHPTRMQFEQTLGMTPTAFVAPNPAPETESGGTIWLAACVTRTSVWSCCYSKPWSSHGYERIGIGVQNIYQGFHPLLRSQAIGR